ncbi:MAG: archease [Candidatus Thorarchaeota archaeon]|jgi:SHS2 domain-containing protein
MTEARRMTQDSMTVTQRLLSVTEEYFDKSFRETEDGSMEPAKWREFDTTADTGIEVWAASVLEVMIEAGGAFSELTTEVDDILYTDEHEIIVEEDGYDVLLHSFLNELLYLLDTKKFVAIGFRKPRIVVSNGTVVFAVTAMGGIFNPEKHESITEIKAVTWHMLTFDKIADVGAHQWYARVVFDI